MYTHILHDHPLAHFRLLTDHPKMNTHLTSAEEVKGYRRDTR